MADFTKFRYEAKDPGGKLKRGTLSAVGREEVIRLLEAQGLEVTFLQEADSRDDLLHGTAAAEDFVAFNNHLASVTRSGLPLPDALGSITEDMQAGPFRDAIEDVAREVRSGRPLGEALRRRRDIFSDIYISLVEAGEKSGRLSGLLAIVARQARGLLELQDKMRDVLLYPTVICLVLLTVYALVSLLVMPGYAAMVADFSREFGRRTSAGVVFVPPLPTRIALVMGQPSVALPVTAAGVAALLYLWFLAPRTRTGRRILQSFFSILKPVRQMHLDYELSRISGTLSMLLYSDVPLDEAVQCVRAFVKDSSLAKALRSVGQALQEGAGFSSALEETGAFPASFTWRVSMGETSGKLRESLEELGEFHLNQAEHLATRLSAVIEPVLIFLTGLAAGCAVVGLVLPFIRILRLIGGP